VFILGLLQWTRAATLYIRLDFISQMNLTIPLPYAIGSALIWGGLLVAASIGLWRLTGWGRWLALAAVTLSQAQGWLDRLLFERSDYSQGSTGFALVSTLVILGLTWIILLRYNRPTRR
jgi:uncharacterized membrane protein (DUF2068 family)